MSVVAALMVGMLVLLEMVMMVIPVSVCGVVVALRRCGPPLLPVGTIQQDEDDQQGDEGEGDEYHGDDDHGQLIRRRHAQPVV